MKKNMLIISVLLLGLGISSCGKIEQIIEKETPENVVEEEEVWTLKVEAGEKDDAVTKALSMNTDGTIKSEWVQNDVIIAYKSGSRHEDSFDLSQ